MGGWVLPRAELPTEPFCWYPRAVTPSRRQALLPSWQLKLGLRTSILVLTESPLTSSGPWGRPAAQLYPMLVLLQKWAVTGDRRDNGAGTGELQGPHTHTEDGAARSEAEGIKVPTEPGLHPTPASTHSPAHVLFIE